MKSFFIVLFFLSLTLNSFAQETEQYYVDKAAKEYYNGNMEAARKTIDLGLKYYPGNQKLLKLKKCLPQNWDAYNNKVKQLKSQGYKEGQGGEGYTSKVLTDPNGKKHVFVKKLTTPGGGGNGPTGPRVPEPTCKFNDEVKKLRNQGFTEGYGGDDDEEKTLKDCEGEVHTYFKKKPAQAITISASFRKTAQNSVQWSNELKNNAEKITIIFNNGIKTFSEEVTGMNSYKFESGDKDFDGVECTVTLKVTLKPNVKMTDVPKLIMKTHC